MIFNVSGTIGFVSVFLSGFYKDGIVESLQ